MTILELLGSFALFFIMLAIALWHMGLLKVSMERDRG